VNDETQEELARMHEEARRGRPFPLELALAAPAQPKPPTSGQRVPTIDQVLDEGEQPRAGSRPPISVNDLSPSGVYQITGEALKTLLGDHDVANRPYIRLVTHLGNFRTELEQIEADLRYEDVSALSDLVRGIDDHVGAVYRRARNLRYPKETGND
jgi:hypothetical protein